MWMMATVCWGASIPRWGWGQLLSAQAQGPFCRQADNMAGTNEQEATSWVGVKGRRGMVFQAAGTRGIKSWRAKALRHIQVGCEVRALREKRQER